MITKEAFVRSAASWADVNIVPKLTTRPARIMVRTAVTLAVSNPGAALRLLVSAGASVPGVAAASTAIAAMLSDPEGIEPVLDAFARASEEEGGFDVKVRDGDMVRTFTLQAEDMRAILESARDISSSSGS